MRKIRVSSCRFRGLPLYTIIMKQDTPDDRSPIAQAIEWSTRLMVIGLEMALPAGGGYWLDQLDGTRRCSSSSGRCWFRCGHVPSLADCTRTRKT